MIPNTKLDEKLEGVDKFRAWKYRVLFILEENDLEDFIKEVPQTKGRCGQGKVQEESGQGKENHC
jgi:hypothetical protein